MATRFYGVATTAAPVSPAFDSWVSTTGAVSRSLDTVQAAGTETRSAVNVTSGSGNNTLGFQLVSAPLAAQTISGTVTIMARGRELAASDNINARVRGIRVFSNDGSTLRGTLLALGNHSVTTEPGTTVAGYQFANATALSSVTAQDGDRIVVELGWGMTTTGTTPQYDLVIGGTGTDHVNTAGPDTTGTVPWVEFSATLSFFVPITSGPPLLPLAQPLGGRVSVVRPGHVQASLIPLPSTTTASGTAALAGAGAVSAAGTVIRLGAATLTGAGTLSAQVTQPAGATLTGAGSLSALSGSAAQGSATLTGAGSLSASGTSAASEGPLLVQLRQPAGVRLSMLRTGTAQFSPAAPTAVTTITGTASLVGAGSLSAVTGAITAGPPLSPVRQPAGGRVTTVRAGHVQASLVVPSAVTTVDGSAALTGAGALTAAGTVIVTGTAALTGAGTLAANVGGVVIGTAALTGAGALAATVTQASGATLTGAGTLAASVGGLTTGTAALTGAGTVSAAPTLIVQGTATLTGAGTVAATVTQAVKATLTGAGSLTAFSGSASQGTATMAGAGALSASASVFVPGTATLAGAGTAAAAAIQRINGTAALVGAGSLAAVPAQRILAAATLTGTGTLTGLGGFVVFGTATLAGGSTLAVVITSAGSMQPAVTTTAAMWPADPGAAGMQAGTAATSSMTPA